MGAILKKVEVWFGRKSEIDSPDEVGGIIPIIFHLRAVLHSKSKLEVFLWVERVGGIFSGIQFDGAGYSLAEEKALTQEAKFLRDGRSLSSRVVLNFILSTISLFRRGRLPIVRFSEISWILRTSSYLSRGLRAVVSSFTLRILKEAGMLCAMAFSFACSSWRETRFERETMDSGSKVIRAPLRESELRCWGNNDRLIWKGMKNSTASS